MWISANSHRDEVKVTIAIFTEQEVTNYFSKIALVFIREKKRKTKICDSETSANLAAILKTGNRHCYNHLSVIIARENEVLDQSSRAIFDNHQCNFTNYYYISFLPARVAANSINFICVSGPVRSRSSTTNYAQVKRNTGTYGGIDIDWCQKRENAPPLGLDSWRLVNIKKGMRSL